MCAPNFWTFCSLEMLFLEPQYYEITITKVKNYSKYLFRNVISLKKMQIMLFGDAWPPSLLSSHCESKANIRFFHQSHNTVHFGGLFALKQWISSSLKHDTVPRVIKSDGL